MAKYDLTKIEVLANVLANDGFGEFKTYSNGMPVGDVKKAFDKAGELVPVAFATALA